MNLVRHLAALVMLVVLLGVSVYAGDPDPAMPKLPPVPKGVADVGLKAPEFSLPDTDGKIVTLQQYLSAGKTVVLYWFNGNCQVIKNHFERSGTFTDLYSAYNKRKVVFLAINSTSPKDQEFGGDAARKKAWLIHYPILLDTAQSVGKAYGAKTTPQFFIISSDGIIRYSGAIDNDPMSKKVGKGTVINYVSQALDEILAGKPVSLPRTRTYGCMIRYPR